MAAMRLSQRDMAEEFNLSNDIERLWKQKFWQFQVSCMHEMQDEIIGKWRLDHFGPITMIEQMRSTFGGQWIAPDTVYTRLSLNDGTKTTDTGKIVWKPMMSDTPSELFDHLQYYNMLYMTGAKRVLIHGLGLGCAIIMALWHKAEHIDVVELDEEVIALTGKYWQGDDRIHIHHGDAFTYKFPPNTRWDVIWHDIWISICEDNLPEIIRLKRRYGGRCKWQGAWSEDRIRRQIKKWNRWRKLNESTM
jgi:hypothetical protein